MYVFLGVGVARKNRKNPKSLLAVQDFLVKKKISQDKKKSSIPDFSLPSWGLGRFQKIWHIFLLKKHTFQLQVLDKST